MAVTKPTAEACYQEGQFVDQHFPNNAGHAAVLTFIGSRIDDADDDMQERSGGTYASGTDIAQRRLAKAVLYLTVGRLWQIVKNVMDGYDQESLPPEFVDPDQAAANRDFYLGEAETILGRYQDVGEEGKIPFARPILISGGVDQLTTTPHADAISVIDELYVPVDPGAPPYIPV